MHRNHLLFVSVLIELEIVLVRETIASARALAVLNVLQILVDWGLVSESDAYLKVAFIDLMAQIPTMLGSFSPTLVSRLI